MMWRSGSMRVGMIDRQAIRYRWESVGSKLDERGRRAFAGGEVRAAGWGGLEVVSAITGLARSTIGRGLKDLDAQPLPKGRERRKGGGRPHLSSRDATLIEDLRKVIEPATLGDPMRPLLWVSKSHDKVADALRKQGHQNIIAKLNAAVVDALADPTVRARLADLGEEIFPRDRQIPEALGVFQKAEIEKWWPIIAARVVEMKTMIRVHLPTSCPAQHILYYALGRIPRLVC